MILLSRASWPAERLEPGKSRAIASAAEVGGDWLGEFSGSQPVNGSGLIAAVGWTDKEGRENSAVRWPRCRWRRRRVAQGGHSFIPHKWPRHLQKLFHLLT